MKKFARTFFLFKGNYSSYVDSSSDAVGRGEVESGEELPSTMDEGRFPLHMPRSEKKKPAV